MLYRFPQPGDLVERVTVIDPQGAKDELGGYSETAGVTVLSNVPARFEWLAAAEKVQDGQLQATATCRVWLRWRAGILPRYRLQYTYGASTHTLRIVGQPQEFRREDWLLLECLEVVA